MRKEVTIDGLKLAKINDKKHYNFFPAPILKSLKKNDLYYSRSSSGL